MTPPPTAATLPAPAVRPGHPVRRGGQRQRPRTLPPRRISGPARSLGAVQHIPDRLLDRLIGGRAWIAVIAFALIGIVGMQLWVVKLGVGIGRALEHTQLLQQENSTLASEDSTLSSAERIERLALARGMQFALPSALRFDTLRGPLDARLAAATLAKPIQAQATSSTPVGYGAATSTEATTSTEASTSTTGTEAGAGTTTGVEAAGAEAAAAQSPASEPPPAGTTTAATTAPATAVPVSPAEPTEAASTPAGSGGGAPAPGG